MLISLRQNGWIDYLISSDHQHNGYATETLEVAKTFAIKNGTVPFLAIDNNNIFECSNTNIEKVLNHTKT